MDGVELTTKPRVAPHRHERPSEAQFGSPGLAVGEVRREGLAEVLVAVARRVPAHVPRAARPCRRGVAGPLVSLGVGVRHATETSEPRIGLVTLPDRVAHLVEDVLRELARPRRRRVDLDRPADEPPVAGEVSTLGLTGEDDHAFHARVEAELLLAPLDEPHRAIGDRLVSSSEDVHDNATEAHARRGYTAAMCASREQASPSAAGYGHRRLE